MTSVFLFVDAIGPAFLAVARGMLRKGQDEGAIPKERVDVEAGESAIFATHAGRPFAAAIFFEPEDHPYPLLFLDVLYVEPGYRGCGVGTTLLRMVCAQAERRGIRRVEFGTLMSNAAMQALGRRAGFRDHALMMEIRLDQGDRR